MLSYADCIVRQVQEFVFKWPYSILCYRYRDELTEGKPSQLWLMFSASFLLASLVWSSVGFGYFIYGKKQAHWVPMVGGLTMIAISYLVPSALVMSLVSLAIIGGVWWLLRQGY